MVSMIGAAVATAVPIVFSDSLTLSFSLSFILKCRAGSARSAARLSSKNLERRVPAIFLNGRVFKCSNNPAMALFNSASEKKVRLRSRANIHRSTISTAFSTFAWSRGFLTRQDGDAIVRSRNSL